LIVRSETENENENENTNSHHRIYVTVPDLITLVDSETYRPILTEEIRYGFRVAVLVIGCHPLWRTEQALKFVGPQAFGYNNVEYKPIADYVYPTPLVKFDKQNNEVLPNF